MRGGQMIISASRRTDIPAFYSDWFMERIREGFVLARNPLNIHQISKIKLTPDFLTGEKGISLLLKKARKLNLKKNHPIVFIWIFHEK